MGRLRSAALLLLYWLSVSPASADIDPSEYEPKTSVRSEKERSRLKAIFEADKKVEAEQLRREAEADARRLAEKMAAWEALPYPVRLTETRCTGCHIAANYTKQRHNRIGWELVVLRMQYLNGVRLGEGERSIIAAHLTQNYPPAGIDAATEAIMQLLAILSPAGLWLAGRGIHASLRRIRAHGNNADHASAVSPQPETTEIGKKLYKGNVDANRSG